LAHVRRRPRIDWKKDLAERLAAGGSIVDTARGPVEYADVGKGSQVLFVHGAPGGYDQTAIVAEHYELSGYRLIGPTRPGYLRTPLATGRSTLEQAGMLGALLDALDITRVPIVAHSTGAAIAIHFAARHPERCAGLYLAGGVYRPLPAARASRFALGFLEPLLQAAETPQHAAAHVVRRLGATMVRARRGRAMPLELAALPRLIETLLPAALRAPGLVNDLQNLAILAPPPFDRLECPVWLTHSKADIVVPIANSRFAARQIEHAHFTQTSGHHYAFYVPGAVDKKGMHTFLARCTPAH
jgi:pimeloyl-ACP methyl ester carboxylesterase